MNYNSFLCYGCGKKLPVSEVKVEKNHSSARASDGQVFTYVDCDCGGKALPYQARPKLWY